MTPPYDNAPPASPLGGEAGRSGPQRARSGSQRRQRTKSLQIALTPEQYAVVEDRARAAGLTPSSYGRAVIFGTPGPRAQRTPPVNAGLLAHTIAALNKIGSLLNQIARVLNAGGAIGLARECYGALAEIREAAHAVRQAVGRKDRDDYQGQSA
jgi:hypothetical protein